MTRAYSKGERGKDDAQQCMHPVFASLRGANCADPAKNAGTGGPLVANKER